MERSNGSNETLKARLNLLIYTSPEQLRAALAEFIEFYNLRRCHEGVGNVMLADVHYWRREQIPAAKGGPKTADTLGRKPNRTTGELEDRNSSLSEGLSHSHKRLRRTLELGTSLQ